MFSSKLTLGNLFFRNVVAGLIHMVSVHLYHLFFFIIKFFRTNFVSCFITPIFFFMPYCLMTNVCNDIKASSGSSYGDTSWAKAVLNRELLSGIYNILKNELAKRWPTNAWKLINNSMISSSSSISLNMYNFLMLFP